MSHLRHRRRSALWRRSASGLLVCCCLASGARCLVVRGATLSDLLAGQYLDAAGARFLDWQLVSLEATAAAPDLAQISVLPLAGDVLQPGLQFAAGGELTIAGFDGIDLRLRYRVQSLVGAGSFTGQTVAIIGPAFGAGGGVATITQEAAATAGGDLGAAVAIADNAAGLVQLTGARAFAPHLGVRADVNVLLQGTTPADTISLSGFTLRFSQTGPGSLAGDYNQDGSVDGVDFLRWQRGQSPAPLSAADLAAWRSSFGQSIALRATTAAVPEPAAHALALAAALAALRRGGGAANLRPA